MPSERASNGLRVRKEPDCPMCPGSQALYMARSDASSPLPKSRKVSRQRASQAAVPGIAANTLTMGVKPDDPAPLAKARSRK